MDLSVGKIRGIDTNSPASARMNEPPIKRTTLINNDMTSLPPSTGLLEIPQYCYKSNRCCNKKYTEKRLHLVLVSISK